MIRCTGRKTTCSTKSIEVLSSFTIPSHSIVSPKVVVMESGEIIFEKVYVSSRPPPTISFKDNWMKELDSEVAGKQQRLPTKIKNGETRGWTRIHQGNRERYLVWSRGHQALNKNGETRRWIKIHTKLRCRCLLKLKKKIKQERGDP